VPTVNPRICEKGFTSRIVSAAQICAGGEKGKDACRGDSGGPLMHLNLGPSPFWHLVGIVSYGPPCGILKEKPRPTVYVDVSKYMDWIVANMYE
jgi:secreted trypsin-like serine protease